MTPLASSTPGGLYPNPSSMISPRADVTAHPRMLTRSSTRPPPLPPVPTPTATLTNPPRALAWYPTASSPRSMPSTSHQYGPRPQNAEPVTGSSSMPVKGKTRRQTNCAYEIKINSPMFGAKNRAVKSTTPPPCLVATPPAAVTTSPRPPSAAMRLRFGRAARTCAGSG